MEAKLAPRDVIEISFEAISDATKGDIAPRDLISFREGDFEALIAGSIGFGGQLPSIKQVHLIDMGNADHREWCFDHDARPCLFQRFPGRRLGSGFAVFHKAGRQRPKAKAWFDGATAEQNPLTPGRDAANDQSRVFIMDMSAFFTDMPR